MRIVDNSVLEILNKRFKGKKITVYLIEYFYRSLETPKYAWETPDKGYISQDWSLDLIEWPLEKKSGFESSKKCLKRKRVTCVEVVVEYDYEGCEYYAIIEGMERIKFNLG